MLLLQRSAIVPRWSVLKFWQLKIRVHWKYVCGGISPGPLSLGGFTNKQMGHHEDSLSSSSVVSYPQFVNWNLVF